MVVLYIQQIFLLKFYKKCNYYKSAAWDLKNPDVYLSSVILIGCVVEAHFIRETI